MRQINKCYIFTKEYTCSVENNSDCFIFQFGDGELVDREGYSYFVYCEYDYQKLKEIIQLWYEDSVETIYLKEPFEKDFIITDFLNKKEIDEILREFHRILDIFKEEI